MIAPATDRAIPNQPLSKNSSSSVLQPSLLHILIPQGGGIGRGEGNVPTFLSGATDERGD